MDHAMAQLRCMLMLLEKSALNFDSVKVSGRFQRHGVCDIYI